MSLSTTIKLPTYSCKIIISVVDSVTIEADRIYKRHKVKETFGKKISTNSIKQLSSE